jgi:hypothetical protein
MKIQFEAFQHLVYAGFTVHVGSPSLGTDYEITHESDHPEGPFNVEFTVEGNQVDRENYQTLRFYAFRNGDDRFPCLERSLPLWFETVNADDCLLYLLEPNNDSQ